MADFIAIAQWPFAMGVSAALFGLFMMWLIDKQHPREPKDQTKPPHRMAE